MNETCEEIVRRDSERPIFHDPRHMAVRNTVRGGAPVAVVIKIGVHKTRKVLTIRIQTNSTKGSGCVKSGNVPYHE